MKRTDYCGLLGEKDLGRKISVAGWVLTKRDMGGIIFIDLRDREGTLQVVFDARNFTQEIFTDVEGLRSQSVISIGGVIRIRDAETYNPKIATGTIELAADQLEILSTAEPLPYPLDDSGSVREDLRLKYRFLDLRRPKMFQNLRFRQQVQRASQAFLDDKGFIEVETPILTKSTPEGARDYLVPSRVHPGTFYALPQSPQIFKQLLMVGGIDKYYQVARCFRDEDLRADRQPEFTQVDMEMSFIEQEDVLVHLESLFKYIFKTTMEIEITDAFPRLTWLEAMDRYGSDKPDLRFDLPIVDLTPIAKTSGFSVFRSVADNGGVVRAINVKGGASFTRGEIDELTSQALGYGAKGMAWIAVRESGELYSVITKFMSEAEQTAILEATEAKPGDFILFCADKLSVVRKTLGGLRIDIAEKQQLRNKDEYKFLFVTDFPQFEYSEEEKRYIATHHPFTMPYPEDVQYLFSDPARVRAQAYDVVLNGIELGSGSIRIHQSDIQQLMFKALGFSPEETEERFGFMINAFRYGTPPHGGFAFGLDRLVMLMVGADSLREVIAFPKVKDASCPLTGAPDAVEAEQLEVLNLLKQDVVASTAAVAKKKSSPALIDVDKVAKLARIRLQKDERAAMADELRAIVSFADKLSSVNTDGIPATAHVVPMSNIFREDIAGGSFDRAEMLADAPSKNTSYVIVPKTVE